MWCRQHARRNRLHVVWAVKLVSGLLYSPQTHTQTQLIMSPPSILNQRRKYISNIYSIMKINTNKLD